MAKQKDLSAPKVGMNRSVSPHILNEGEFAFQLNGNSYDEGGEKFNLTDEHSNILASKFKAGFKFVGGKNHVVRNKTYIFLTNPTTGVSEIGCIQNVTDFTFVPDTEAISNCTDCPQQINIEATPLENQVQTEHQTYETLLEDSCNLCLGFDIDHPIIDIIIKEQNIGTKLFWTSTPGNKEFRYIELDDLDQYKVTGDDNCGAEPTPTCLDCDKLRVFRLYSELKIKDYQRTVGGNLKKGSYEILGAYSDILGNEFTSYTPLTPIIPIFDEANVIHEQEDNNAETNFAIKVELDTVDIRFDYYKVAVKYYTSNGVFTSFVEGIHGTSDKVIILSNNDGQSINNAKLGLKKPFVETVDGATASNNILILNGVREREPINLQPAVSLMGLGVQWMSFRAKEDLYANADSYKYIGYNRDENVALSIDFGFKDGYRSNPFIFVPRPATLDELSDFTTAGDDYDSITTIVGDCDGNLRDKKWQFYNTATEIGVCPLNEDVDTVQQVENVVTYTTVNVPSAPAGTIVLSLEDEIDYVNLEQFIEDNKDTCGNVNSPIATICPYIDLTLLTAFNNPPTSQPECDPFTLSSEEVFVAAVNNEQSVFNDKPISEYAHITPPQFCNYTIVDNDNNGNDLIDKEFAYAYNVDSYNTFGGLIDPLAFVSTKARRPDVYNLSCSSAEDLVKVTQANISVSNYGSYYHLNLGADTVAELQTSKTMSVTSGTRFTGFLHEGALWFRTDINNRDKFFIELSEETSCSGSAVADGSEVRVSIFDRCSDAAPIFSKIVDLNNHQFIEIDVENDLIDGATAFDFTTLITDTLYISVEVPIVESQGYGEAFDWEQAEEDQNFPDPPTTRYRLAPLCGCFNIVDREEEFDSVTVSYDSIDIYKGQKYESTCTFEIPVLQDCEPVPYKYGELGFYESTDKYPDNDELYNSSNLVITKSLITNADFLSKLDIYTETDTGTQLVLSDEADFRCKNIRHYKLPDNKISPFIRTESIASNSESIISPLGFTIDGEVVNNMLDVAVENGLITQEQRDNIIDYKIYRADSTLDRSVVASGLVFNTKSYTVEGEKINYFNYPFNSLGIDKYFPGNTDEPFDKIQAISPEFDYFRPSLPNEMSLQGFMFGKSNSRIIPVEEHAKMVILGDKARSLANTLAILEVTAEVVIESAQALSNAQVWFVGGFANGASVGVPAYIASGLILAIGVVEGLVGKVGRYRLQWEQAFENLGAPYNFGYYSASGSNYNYMKPLQTDGDRLRGLSIRKYLKSGMLNVSDTTSGNIVKVNNIDREEAPFFSLGDYPINNLDAQYTSFDNSDTAPNFSSQLLSSEIGCHKGKSPEQLRNIASPYVAFKNYIPNQYGTVDSIKWVDTTYCIPITETGPCNGILGGDTFISRHSKKRKARIFETDLLGSADLTPFPYRFNSNYGDPRYYIDYKVNSEFQSGNKLFPSIFYDVQFDCLNGTGGFYVEPPGKFYLYSIGFTNFLCETRVNTNFRNARKEPWNQFYPQNTDYEAISQPNTVALTRREEFFYNKAYLQTSISNIVLGLPEYYSREDEARKAYNINSGIYSLPDVNENSITEPWLLYRPNDKFTLESRYGRLINMKGIESDQILMYFEDALQLQNAVNKFTDGSTKYTADLGDGGIFAKRALTLRSTDIGYGGSQSKHTLSCEFGHFHADLKRGQVFNYVGGTDLQEISRYSNGKPNGMDVWFKEHLPLKFLRYFPDYEGADNPYNGMGIHWGYDSKYRRVILTKKDYVPVAGQEGNVVTCGPDLFDSNLDNYQAIISTYQGNGYTFEGIEDCQLKFTKPAIPDETDIYAFFDTSSMQEADGVDAATALNAWFTTYQTNNPTYQGNLYIIPFGNEQWVNYPNLLQTGAIASTGTGLWPTIANLPPNLNTGSWVAPTDLIVLAFVDETNNQYHGGAVAGGFSSSGVVQPTATYTSDFNNFVTNYNTNFNFFRGVIYPIVQSVTGVSGALVLQALAAIEGTTLTAGEIAATNTTVDVSILLTENPYSVLGGLKDYDWKGVYDKTSPASAVFNSSTFADELDELVLSGVEEIIAYEPLDEISILDESYFREISWTITYKPETGSWESYMSYTPNYYINHTDYFQSGLNSNDDTFGLWSHLLTNKSYRVFYGQKFPYIIEYPIKNQYFSKRLEDLSWNAQLRRYHNEYDFAPIEANPFTAVTIYNNYENSGRLIPVKNNGTLSQLSKYPITNADNSQDVLISYDNYRYNLNYFYNRTKSNVNNQPIWLWDENQINKTINPKAVSFYGKKTLERLKGNFFIVRLERDGNTNYDLDFRWSEQTTNPIQ